MDVRVLGHACFSLSDGDTTVLIDPFLSGNPVAATSADAVEATTLLLTHGHGDHVGDTVAVAKRHDNTFPLIETDPQAFKSDVEAATRSTVVVLEPGETHTT